MPRHPSKGPGWGGAAKGAGRAPAKKFTSDEKTRHTVPGGKGDPIKMANRQTQRERDAITAQQLKDHILKLAKSATREDTQLAAATAWLNRQEGMPVARTITMNVDDVRDLSDTELAAELARYNGTPVDADAGNATAGTTPVLPGILH